MTKKLKKYFLQTEKIIDLATKLYGGDEKTALKWISTPSDLCFGVSPLAMIFSGGGEFVVKWLKERSKKPKSK